MRGGATRAVLRDIWFGRVWRANACLLVEERPSLGVLWLPRGAPAKIPVDGSHEELRIPGDAWTLADRPVRRAALALLRPEARWSLWHFWEGDEFLYWYVNFERDVRRTALGFDIVDEKLDLIVDPDGRIVWKDEDELEQAALVGLVDASEVRAEAARVLADPPWPSGWEDFRPDPGWEMPQLPPGWDVLSR
jgi:hypothetical protein